MRIGEAVQVLHDGGRVTRDGWNGQGMFLVLVPGSTFTVDAERPYGRAVPELAGREVQYRDHIDIFTTSGRFGPWTATNGDLLADDWRAL